MIISLATIESGYHFETDAKISDGFQILKPAVGGGRCADGSYIRNYYGTSFVGQKPKFEIEIDKTTESTIVTMVKNYETFNLMFQDYIFKVGIEEYNFGTGNNDITFVILEDYN